MRYWPFQGRNRPFPANSFPIVSNLLKLKFHLFPIHHLLPNSHHFWTESLSFPFLFSASIGSITLPSDLIVDWSSHRRSRAQAFPPRRFRQLWPFQFCFFSVVQAVHQLPPALLSSKPSRRKSSFLASACRTSSNVSLCCSGLARHQQLCWTPSFLVRLLLLWWLGAEGSGCAKSWWQGGRRCRCPADPWKLPLPCQTIATQSSYFWLSSSCKGLLFSLFFVSHLQAIYLTISAG